MGFKRWNESVVDYEKLWRPAPVPDRNDIKQTIVQHV